MTKTPHNDDATRIQRRDQATVQRDDSATRVQHTAQRQSDTLVQVGDVLKDRFEIKTLLGVGGMSQVFRALDRRRLEAQDKNPYVAVKVLGADFLGHPQGFVALQREARKSQTLAHPNIITVYDFDRDGNTVFMTMEALQGTPLETLIRNHPMGVPQAEAVRIITEVAKGLAYAHSKQIVHSDLKPGNIFIGNDGTVKILDFGIARAAAAMEEASNNDHTVFDAGELGGLTPAYASLEMFQHSDPHPSDDIYALGLIGYELLTGKHPFGRETAQNVQVQSLIAPTLKNLKRQQLTTLKEAIAIERGNRVQDASEFLKAFSARSPLMAWAIAAAFIGTLAALIIVAPTSKEPGPDIPFENLTEKQQNAFNQALDEATQAMNFGDMNGALFYYNSAYQLHPRNPRVMQGLDAIVAQVLSAAENKKRSRPKAIREQIDTLLEYESLAGNEALLEFQKALQE